VSTEGLDGVLKTKLGRPLTLTGARLVNEVVETTSEGLVIDTAPAPVVVALGEYAPLDAPSPTKESESVRLVLPLNVIPPETAKKPLE
jgi:hypothetical protein